MNKAISLWYCQRVKIGFLNRYQSLKYGFFANILHVCRIKRDKEWMVTVPKKKNKEFLSFFYRMELMINLHVCFIAQFVQLLCYWQSRRMARSSHGLKTNYVFHVFTHRHLGTINNSIIYFYNILWLSIL